MPAASPERPTGGALQALCQMRKQRWQRRLSHQQGFGGSAKTGLHGCAPGKNFLLQRQPTSIH
jgi:hypothetical protein